MKNLCFILLCGAVLAGCVGWSRTPSRPIIEMNANSELERICAAKFPGGSWRGGQDEYDLTSTEFRTQLIAAIVAYAGKDLGAANLAAGRANLGSVSLADESNLTSSNSQLNLNATSKISKPNLNQNTSNAGSKTSNLARENSQSNLTPPAAPLDRERLEKFGFDCSFFSSKCDARVVLNYPSYSGILFFELPPVRVKYDFEIDHELGAQSLQITRD